MALFELVVEAGAEDLEQDEDAFMVTTAVEAFEAVRTALQEADVAVEEASLVYVPTTTVKADPEQARKLASFLEKLEESQDVQAVYSTLDEDSILTSV